MDSFVILILGLVALVKSDIGYRYNVPLTSYDVPFHSVGGLTNDRKYYHIENQPFPTSDLVSVTPSSLLSTPSILSTSSILSTPASILQTPIHEYVPFTGVEDLPQQKLSVISSHGENGLLNNVPISEQKQDIPVVNLLDTSLNKNSENVVLDSKSNFASDNSQENEVQKHLYFYSAPDEPEEIRTRIVTPPPVVKKNVKILFIKTPTFNTAPITIPVLPQNDDKTLVYVLVKKPEEQTIVIPTPEPTKPPKPEVYFIKYKTQKDAQEAISNIQDAHNSENQQSVDINQNINLYSRISPSTERTLIAETPTLISTTSLPTALGDSGLHIGGGQNGLSSIHTQVFPSLSPEVHSGNVFSSDAITKFDSSLIDNQQGFGGLTTVSPLNFPAASNENLGNINVHQVYGPPRNR